MLITTIDIRHRCLNGVTCLSLNGVPMSVKTKQPHAHFMHLRLLSEIDIRRPFRAHLSAGLDTCIRRAYLAMTHIWDLTLSVQGKAAFETKTNTYLLTRLLTYLLTYLLH